MTDGEYLYQAILDEPRDDVPRLIYADWLEIEANQPQRAEFIRLQVELASRAELGRLPDSVHRWLRMRALFDHLPLPRSLSRWPQSWLGLHPPEGYDPPTCFGLYRRGFLDEIHAPLAELEKHLPAVVKDHPLTRAVASDKQPWFNITKQAHQWSDMDYGPDSDSDRLPAHLCEQIRRLNHPNNLDYPRDRLLQRLEGGYESSQLALDHLSEALLTLARQ